MFVSFTGLSPILFNGTYSKPLYDYHPIDIVASIIPTTMMIIITYYYCLNDDSDNDFDEDYYCYYSSSSFSCSVKLYI